MYDNIEKLGDSIIQHGNENDRIYLMKMGRHSEHIIESLESLATLQNYSKIFCKVPHNRVQEFIDAGYIEEASIPNFYKGKTDVKFLSKFLDSERSFISKKNKSAILKNLEIAIAKGENPKLRKLNPQFELKKLDKSHVEDLVDIYKIVFDTYPFPIHDPGYIAKTMDENIVYYGAICEGKLVAVSSSETDPKYLNSEMTDFATHPDYKGYGLALHLLNYMEADMERLGYKTLYTIARSFSAAMNITFSKAGYKFSGTLVNNTNISGKIESMNVWSKQI